MKIPHRLLRITAITVICIASVAAARAQGQVDADTFGAPITIDPAAAITVSSVLESTALRDTMVLVGGTIADVCTRKGCWLVVGDGAAQMRVTFKDYGFFVPTDVHGRTVMLQGVVRAEEISEEDARHYAEEATIGPKPEEIVGAQRVVTMEATGVVIVGE